MKLHTNCDNDWNKFLVNLDTPEAWYVIQEYDRLFAYLLSNHLSMRWIWRQVGTSAMYE